MYICIPFRYTILLVITLLFFSPAFTQELSYKHYAVRDGLPGSTVYQTIQDKNGFIWFATNQGVSRFDGRNFRNFSRQDGLPDNEVMRLFLDSQNHVWCTTFVGIPAVFYNDTIIRFDDCTDVLGIYEDLQTNTLYLTRHTLSPAGETYAVYQTVNTPGHWSFSKRSSKDPYGWPVLRASGKEANFYLCNIDSVEATVWVKSKKGEHRYGIHLNQGDPFAGNGYLSLNSNERGVAFSTVDSLYYADEKGLYPILSLASMDLKGNLNSVFCENDSTLWVCTRHHGVLRIRNFLKPTRTMDSFFQTMFCTSVMKDQENGYWVTTHGDGVFYLPNLSFYQMTSLPAFAHTDVRCIGNIGQNTIAAGFANGNILFIDSRTLASQYPPEWGSSHKNRQVLDIRRVRSNLLLVASDAGLYTVHGQQNVQLIDTHLAAKGLFIAPGANYVMASSGGIRIRNVDTGSDSFPYRGRATCITGLNDRYYWGTLHGVYTYYNKTIDDLGKRYAPLSGIINHLAVSPDSALWAATQEGVVILKYDRITRIRHENGMLSDNCKHVWFDGTTAWVSSNKGISRVAYRWEGKHLAYTVSNITEEDGLITNDVNQTTTDDKYLWAATAQGISFFSKHYVSQSVRNPLINISRIVSGGIAQPVTDTVRLQYPDNKLQIELSGISYRSGRNIQYEYRLRRPEPDNHWSPLANNAVEFPALPFGTFVFEVRAIDRWGKKSTVPKTLVIIHAPPFWRSDAFAVALYLFTAIGTGIGFYVFLRAKHRKKEHEYQLAKKMQDLEMKALHAQMNPHFIFNCLTSIQYHIMRADIRSATNYLHKFSTLIRRTLQHSTASSIPLSEEIKLLTLYLDLEKLRLGERMEYAIEVAENLQTEQLHIPSMIVQPYVENAVKHGVSPLKDRTGMVIIKFERRDDYIECMIDDNGPGIHTATEDVSLIPDDHVSLGTAITASRINTLNVIRQKKIRLAIVNKSRAQLPGTGTIIHLSFPILTD